MEPYGAERHQLRTIEWAHLPKKKNIDFPFFSWWMDWFQVKWIDPPIKPSGEHVES